MQWKDDVDDDDKLPFLQTMWRNVSLQGQKFSDKKPNLHFKLCLLVGFSLRSKEPHVNYEQQFKILVFISSNVYFTECVILCVWIKLLRRNYACIRPYSDEQEK